MSGNPVSVRFSSPAWQDGGTGFLELSQQLRLVTDSLCADLAAAGPAWGMDDLGSAFISGGDGKPGFGTTEPEVLTQLADEVNATAYTGTAMQRSSATFATTEEALTKSIQDQSWLTPADLQALVDRGVSGIPLPRAYTLPRYSGGTVKNDPLPADWGQIVSLLEQLTSYRQPDGSQGGLYNIVQSLRETKNELLDLNQNVTALTSGVTGSNAGQAATAFGSFVGLVAEALDWLADAVDGLLVSTEGLLIQKQSAWDQLYQAVKYLDNAQATLSVQAQSDMTAAEASFYNLVRKEGQALLTARKALVSNVLAGLNGLPATPTPTGPAPKG